MRKQVKDRKLRYKRNCNVCDEEGRRGRLERRERRRNKK